LRVAHDVFDPALEVCGWLEPIVSVRADPVGAPFEGTDDAIFRDVSETAFPIVEEGGDHGSGFEHRLDGGGGLEQIGCARSDQLRADGQALAGLPAWHRHRGMTGDVEDLR